MKIPNIKNIFKKDINHEQTTITKEIRKIEQRFELLRIGLALFIALGVVLLIIAVVSDNPFNAIKELLLGPLATTRRIGNVIEAMIPITFTGLAVTMVFKTHRFNLASESAFFLGAMVTLMVGMYSPFSALPTMILAMIAGFSVGALVGIIPALINFKFGANELVISLMLNYVVSFYVKYLLNYKVRDPDSASLQSFPMKEGVDLGNLFPGTRIHYGLIIMAVVVVIAYIILYKTKWGYALRMTGLNEKFSKYSGIKVTRVIIAAQALGIGIAGLGGSVEMLGLYNRFRWAESPGYGWDGIIVAALARNNPAGVPLAAFFLAYIRVGADILNRTTSIPAEIISLVQAIIIILIAAQAFLSKQKQRQIVKTSVAFDQAGGK
jgi:ABC-type uncharacterized transport system permease subunit